MPPLLEMKWNACLLALVAELPRPTRQHGSGVSAALAAGNDPIDGCKPRGSLVVHGDRSTDPSNGSHDKNLHLAGTFNKIGNRSSARFWSSTVVPIQTLSGQSFVHGAFVKIFCGRFVSSNQSSHSVRAINCHNFSRAGFKSARNSKTSAIEAQNTRLRRFADLASAFHLSGSAQCFSVKNLRSSPAPKSSDQPVLPMPRRNSWRSLVTPLRNPPRIKGVVRPFNC